MAKTKEKGNEVVHEIEGKLMFKSIDRMVARFTMEDKGQGSNRNVEFPANLFPEDFDPTVDTVDGSYSMEFSVKRG